MSNTKDPTKAMAYQPDEGTLKKYGRHLNNCKAFPATSEEQIARDCTCGLQAALAAPAPRLTEDEVREQHVRMILGWFDKYRAHAEIADDLLPVQAADKVFRELRTFVAESLLAPRTAKPASDKPEAKEP
jgi:hypothetical protein